MSDIVISPNMNLPVPVVGTEIGPDWANDLNACMSAIDGHTHAPGQGVLITPDGLSINADLPINGHNLTTARTVNFTAQVAPLATAVDIGCIYVSGKDLYYNDEDGNRVRITQGGAVTGATGTITGLPSGTASASFAAGTFTFQSATNTPASMAVGPLIIGAATASPNTVTVGASASVPGSYSTLLPLALPAATAIAACASSGQQSWIEPDNTTFGIQAGKYGVLDGGIGPTQLANVNFNVADVSSETITGGTFVQVTGMQVDLTCSGRPVMIIITSKPSATQEGALQPNNDGAFSLRLERDSSVLSNTLFYISTTTGITPSWTIIDQSPPVGAHTYFLLAKVTTGPATNLTFSNTAIYAVEL